MTEPGIRGRVSLRKPSLMQAVHWVAHGVFKAEGYRWEVRRNGDMKLGYWRKILKPKDQRSSYPKRFVLIPGFGDTPLSWHLVITFLQPILKQNFDEILLFDFPGFGGFLSREKSFPSMDLMIQSVSDALDSLKPHTIMGHSLGGWLAADYAALCGSGARPISNKLNYSGPQALLLVNPSGIYPDKNVRQGIVDIFTSCGLEGISPLRPHLFAKEPSWFRLILPHFQRFFEREDVLQFMNSIRENHEITEVAHQIKSKVWLIWGEKDTLIPVSCANAWLQNLNPARKEDHQAVFICGAGHSPQIEQPAVTAAVVAQILAERTPHRIGKRWWKVVQSNARFLP
jgi:pimeloyl-ACP methyl ester carboxylesterase